MDEIYALKKALLMERRERGALLSQLADLQLKVLEGEHKAELAKQEAAKAEDGNT